MKLPIKAGQDYIPRFGWVDRTTLWVETVTRDHKRRDIYFADAFSGQSHRVLAITDEKFVDENYDVTVAAGNIVLTNWTDGHNHLYLYSYGAGGQGAATLVRQLTSGDFEVAEILGVDTAAKVVKFSSNEGNALEKQLWQVGFDGQRKQVSAGAGFHEGNFAPSGNAFVDEQSALMSPPADRLCEAAGKCNVFWTAASLESYQLKAPLPLEVKAHDGTTLYGTLLLPEGATGAASVPLIVNPYGGPGIQVLRIAGAEADCCLTKCWRSMVSLFCMRIIGAWRCGGGRLRRRPGMTLDRCNWRIS